MSTIKLIAMHPLSTFLALLLLPFIFLLKRTRKTSKNTHFHFPVSYPLIGCYRAFLRKDRLNYIASLLRHSPTSSYTFRLPFSRVQMVMTANPDVVQHILRHKFQNYERGDHTKSIMYELMGNGIINTDGAGWKFQRQIVSKIFCSRAFWNNVVKVVDAEVSDCLLPVLAQASAEGMVLDLQDLFLRLTFDNICKIAFGYDPKYLSLPLPDTNIATAINNIMLISSKRFGSFFPIFWKLKRLLNLGSEKRLKEASSALRDFVGKIVRRKLLEKRNIISSQLSSDDKKEDILSRFVEMGHYDEAFLTDNLINAIIGGRDTTSGTLAWFFWHLAKNSRVEQQLLKEILGTESEKEMVYTHACLCETMRLYPPMAIDRKEAVEDDMLPDGTMVRGGDMVLYFSYAMGRSEKIWGIDWAEFRPERWLERDDMHGKWRFVGKDQYTFPVFHAGPRICLGKDMAFYQMKKVVAAIVRNYRVVSMREDEFDPVYVFRLISKMRNSFPVRFVKRENWI